METSYRQITMISTLNMKPDDVKPKYSGDLRRHRSTSPGRIPSHLQDQKTGQLRISFGKPRREVPRSDPSHFARPGIVCVSSGIPRVSALSGFARHDGNAKQPQAQPPSGVVGGH
jgi:hypothetical protein